MLVDSLEHLLIDNAPIGAYLLDSNFDILHVNKRGLPTLGTELDALVGKNIMDVLASQFTEELPADVRPRFERTLATGQSFHASNYATYPGGGKQAVYFDWEIHRIDLGGSKKGLVCYFTDITKHIELRQELQASEQRFRDYFDAMPIVGWIARPDGFLEFYNRKWYESLGIGHGETDGWKWESVQHPDYLAEVKKHWMHSLETGDVFEMKFPLKCRNGEFRMFLTRAFPMRDADGSISSWVGNSVDIEDQTRASERLEEKVNERTRELLALNEELQRLAAVISHETQEPILNISSYLKLLAVRYKDRLGSDADEFITKCLTASRRLERMIDDLWNYARVSRSSFELRPTSLGACLEEARAELQAEIRDRQAKIEVGTLPTVEGNREMLVKLFHNLLANSIKYCLVQPDIRIETKQHDKECIISVRDNGVGIDPVYFGEVFKLYSRLSKDQDETSTGMGLAICKKIVDAHHGRIWMEHATIGTTVCIAFPCQ